MKKRIIIVLAAALIFCLFAAGCSSKDDPAVTEAPAVSPTPEPTPEPCVIMGKSYPLNIESIDLRGLNDTLVSGAALHGNLGNACASKCGIRRVLLLLRPH